MQNFIEKFIKGFTEFSSKTRNTSKMFNHRLVNSKYVCLHPLVTIVPEDNDEPINFLVSFTNTNDVVYKLNKDTQYEVIQLVEKSGWHDFIETGMSKEELECIHETVYIETSMFTPIPLSVATWDDLLNAPKLGDADLEILQETFEEYHDIDGDYEATQYLYELFGNNDKKPDSLELRVVFSDVDQDEKYGDRTILVFWKDQFIAVANDYINRYSHNLTFRVSNVEYWKEMMQELYNRATINVKKSPLRGAELLDIASTDVENITSVPGFTEFTYGE